MDTTQTSSVGVVNCCGCQFPTGDCNHGIDPHKFCDAHRNDPRAKRRERSEKVGIKVEAGRDVAPTFRERFVEIPFHILHRIVGLPDDISIERVVVNHGSRAAGGKLSLVVVSERFQPIPEGSVIPKSAYTLMTDRDGNHAGIEVKG